MNSDWFCTLGDGGFLHRLSCLQYYYNNYYMFLENFTNSVKINT